jgi:hypothetical protein
MDKLQMANQKKKNGQPHLQQKKGNPGNMTKFMHLNLHCDSKDGRLKPLAHCLRNSICLIGLKANLAKF